MQIMQALTWMRYGPSFVIFSVLNHFNMRVLLTQVTALLLPFLALAQTSQVGTIKAQEELTVLAFSHDSRYVARGDVKGNVVLQNMPYVNDESPVSQHTGKVTSIAFSPDGNYIFSAGEDQRIIGFNTTNSARFTVAASSFEGEQATLVKVAPNNRFFVSAAKRTIKVWDLNNRQTLHTFDLPAVSAIAISADARWLLATSAEESGIKVWNLETGAPADALGEVADGPYTDLAFSFDGRRVAALGTKSRTLRLWNFIDRNLVASLKFDKETPTKVLFTPDNQYLVTGTDKGKVKVWDTQDPALELKLSLTELDAQIQSMGITNDGKHFAAITEGEEAPVLGLQWLALSPWRPADLAAPTITLLNPRGAKQRAGKPTAVAYQKRVRVSMVVSDISGVKEVKVNGTAVQRSLADPTKYEGDQVLMFPENQISELRVAATDSLGNTTEQVYEVEYKKLDKVADGTYHALLIGVEAYEDANLAQLDNPISDARRLAATLRDYYTFSEENIQVMENPTKAAILAKLDELSQSLGKTDNLFIFYAGHGTWDESVQQGFWMPKDAVADAARRSTWLSNSQLQDYLRGLKCAHVLLVADACFSGGLFKSRASIPVTPPAIEEMYRLASRKAMTSGALKTVPDKSVFVEHLTRRLESNYEDYVSAMELFNSFRNDVIASSPNGQVPLYGEVGSTGDEGGEFIFIRAKNQ